MIFRTSPFGIAIAILPVSKALSHAPDALWILDSSPQKIFAPTCQLDEQPDKGAIASQLHNITQSSFPHNEGAFSIQNLATWVSEPFCMPPPSSLSPGSTPYCVWTSRDFHNGRGISIIAPPEVANSLASSQWFINAHMSSNSFTEPRVPGYKVKQLPGRGLGLVTNTTYARGDLIMAEVPLLLSSLSLEKSNLTEKEQLRLYRTATSRLPKASRDLVMGLHGHPDPKGIQDRFNANAFNVFDFAGVFPAIARLNHDCRPNAAFYFDKSTFTQRIQAVRPISMGEEITISYLSHYLPHEERARRTHSHWGFTCSCALCSSPSRISASDTRLRRIRELEVLIYQANNPSSPSPPLSPSPPSSITSSSTSNDETIALAEDLFELYNEEELDVALARVYDHLVEVYRKGGYTETARMYAELGVEAARLWPGVESVEGRRMRGVLEG